MISAGVHVDQLFYEAPGGIGTYLRELIPQLARLEVNLTLFHARFEQPPERWLSNYRREVVPFDIRRLYPWWALLGRPLLPLPLRRLDVLHAPSPSAIPPPAPGQRLVVTVHDLAFLVHPELFPGRWRMLFRSGMRRAVRSAAAFLTVSEHTARDLTRLYKVPPSKIHVTPLAASLPTTPSPVEDALRRLGVSRPYVLSVGTIEPRKNLGRLIRAYRAAVSRGKLPHLLVIVGPRGWRAAQLLRDAAARGPGEILVLGKATATDLDALYRGADVLAYPSLYEGFGLPVLEAMARGIPVLTSNTSSLPEVAGDAAVLVDPSSVRAIADGLRSILSDATERSRLSEAGRARAGAFSWERTARLTVEAYEGSLHSSP
ncbi:MAG TPA: glycosyltransferase family 1 protein [Actinomycetota bacterium]|nr:glycosyltransferase family 1 protein [Actinomycetota bacterium]